MKKHLRFVQYGSLVMAALLIIFSVMVSVPGSCLAYTDEVAKEKTPAGAGMQADRKSVV